MRIAELTAGPGSNNSAGRKSRCGQDGVGKRYPYNERRKCLKMGHGILNQG
jgi:hypothetical protein